jgi:hypothetical protein
VTAVSGTTLTFDQPAVNGAAVQKSGPLIAGTTNDLNVTGARGGTAGAVREFTRFICRLQGTTQYGPDPYTGTNMGSEITTAFNNAGFTVTPTSPATFRSPGSKCFVASSGS